MEAWQRRCFKREQAVRQAVDAADRIIMEASDGSKQETDYLTAKVAEEWITKVLMTHHAAIQKYDVEQDRLTSTDASKPPDFTR